MKIAFLFGQLGLQYIYIFFLHTLASVNTGRRVHKSPRKCGVPAAFHNFFLFSLNSPSVYIIFSQLHSIEKGRLYVQKQITPRFPSINT